MAQNERKLIYYRGLREQNRLPPPKKQTQFKPNSNPVLSAVERANLETTPGAKYNNGLTVHASEPGVVTPCHGAAGIGTRRVSRANGQMPWLGYNNFVTRVPTVVFPDKGAAGKGDC